MTACTECGLGFDPADDEEDVCPECQFDWAREHCPELLGGLLGPSDLPPSPPPAP